MRYLYVVYAILTFVLLFFTVLPFILLLSLFGAWGRRAIWRLVQAWAYVWFFLTGIRNKNIYESKPDKYKTYIVIANHCSYLDTPVIFRAIPFFVRPLATFEYSKIPIFGILYKQLTVMIDRSSQKSKTEGAKVLKKTLDEGSSIFIFPEGKFNQTQDTLLEFYDGAFKIAMQTNTAILPLLFLDTDARMSYKSIWKFNPGKNRVAFLPEVNPEDFSGDIRAFKMQVHSQMKAQFEHYKKVQ